MVMGVHARMMNRALRIFLAANNKINPTTIIFINHFYEKIGIMFGAKKETKGGKELKLLSAIRVEFKRGEWLEEKGEKIGHTIKAIIKKNDFGVPESIVEYNFNFVQGQIDNLDELKRLAIIKGIIKQTGPYYIYENKKFQGKAELGSWLEKNTKEIEEKL